MSIARFDGVNQVDIDSVKRFENNNWIDADSVKRFDGSNWIETWSSKKIFKLTYVSQPEIKSLISLTNNNKTVIIDDALSFRTAEVRFECADIPIAYGDTIKLGYTNGASVSGQTRLFSSTSAYDSYPLSLNQNGYAEYTTTIQQIDANHAIFKYYLNGGDYQVSYDISDTIDTIYVNDKKYNIEFGL